LFALSGFVYLLIQNKTFVIPKQKESNAFPIQESNAFQSGDIIFQTSKSSQSKAIQLATGSVYSHMGILVRKEEQFYVYEAVKTVRFTPIHDWINRGENEQYVVKRLKNASKILTPRILKKMKRVGEQYKGKIYDLYFGWSDDKMYCSELVWKIYKETLNIEIGQLETLTEFDLSHPVVQQKIKERYGSDIPMTEQVISPVAMFDSEYLIEVEQ